MPDLATFRGIRPPRRTAPPSRDVLQLVPKGTDMPDFVARLIRLTEDFSLDQAQRAARAAEMAHIWLELDPDPSTVDVGQLELLTDRPEASDDVIALWALVQLDRWLTSKGNRPEPHELDPKLLEIFERANAPDPARLPRGLDQAWDRLVSTLAAALLLRSQAERARQVTRLLMIAGLVYAWDQRSGLEGEPALDSADAIFGILRYRMPLMPSPPFPEILPEPQVRLVRDATVSDLQVVRSEWRCYQPGEIAEIRNVMAGERLEHRTVRIDEREVTEREEVERTTLTERIDETSTSAELSEQTRRELELAIKAEAQVDTSGQYGPTHVTSHAGIGVDFSLSDANERATRLARQAVSRAMTRVEERVRTERTERLLTRFEDHHTHELQAKERHIRGLYRWVDRIDRLQMYRFPDRLQLEFQLPEPGRFLLDQLSHPSTTGTVEDPGEFTIAATDITRENYGALATRFKAAGVPPPPEDELAVTHSLALDPISQLPADDSKEIWNPPVATKAAEVAIPTGYEATSATVSVRAAPVRAKWRREREKSESHEGLEGFHTLVATIAVGDKRWTEVQPGPANHRNTVQIDATPDAALQYLDAQLDFSHADQALSPPLQTKAPVTLTTVAASSAAGSVELACKLTDQAWRRWQLDVFDALLGAWEAQMREYRNEQARLGLGAAKVFERSPARHAEMIRDELKRHVIAWLLGESASFAGRPAVGPDTPDIDPAEVLRTAADIQFLEQAFEWTNLTYVTYPYYWAARDRWDELMDLDASDPELARFLRSGSARVVVPARPKLAEAVGHWLVYRQPWSGGAPPLPGSSVFISVAQEIRDLTQPPEDGEPGESWEIRLPTTHRWLDDAETLPRNPLARLGQPPHEPEVKLCGDVNDDGPDDSPDDRD